MQKSFRKHEARALNDIGLVYLNSNQLDLAYEKISAALKIRKEIEDIEGIATSYNNIGSIFISKKRYLKAYENFEKSISIAEEIGNKTELSLYFRNIGDVFRLQNKLDEALLKINEALDIDKENADICGIGHCLNSIGAIFLTQGKFKEGINKLNDGLRLFEEIGDKRAISSSYNNIGSFYIESKNYHFALSYFFKSFDLNIKTGNKLDQANVINWINSISTEVGKEEFKVLANQVYNELDSDIQGNIQLSDFVFESTLTALPEVGRNDPCPCGSGKKYKRCHGANQ